MDTISVTPELAKCFRHEGEDCARCDGSGYRPVRCCAECEEPAGSISAGTGKPLVRSREYGRFYHVHCRPEDSFVDAHYACLERLADG